MLSAELYKLRTHRKPWALAAILMVGVLAPATVLAFYTPDDPTAYGAAFTSVFVVLAPVLAIELGAWLLGTEYRNDTAKRLVAGEPRRMRVLASKAAVGVTALAAALTLAGSIGWAASRLVGSMNDYTVAWNGSELLAAGLFALGAGVVAFSLSAITKSDTFAVVATFALVLILEPLITLIPKVGSYTFGTALGSLTDKISGEETYAEAVVLSTGQASVTLALWLAAFVGAGGWLFANRDV